MCVTGALGEFSARVYKWWILTPFIKVPTYLSTICFACAVLLLGSYVLLVLSYQLYIRKHNLYYIRGGV